MVLLELRRALMERIDASLVRANKLIRLLQVRRGEVHKFHEGGTSRQRGHLQAIECGSIRFQPWVPSSPM